MLELSSFQSFLFLLGSCFVPLFAVLLADWLAAGVRYDRRRAARRRADSGRGDRRLGRGLRRLPVALADRAELVGRAGAAARSARRGGSGRRCRASPCRSSSRCSSPGGARRADRGGARMSRIALVGNLTVDRVAGGAAARRRRRLLGCRAAAHVGADAVVVTRCAPGDRDVALAPLEAFGLPVVCARRGRDDGVQLPLRGRPSRDDGRRRRRSVVAGRRRRLGAPSALAGAGWVLVAGLLRVALSRRRPSRHLPGAVAGCCSTRRGSCGWRETGPLERDARVDRGVLSRPRGPQAERGRGPRARGRARARIVSARSASAEVVLTLRLARRRRRHAGGRRGRSRPTCRGAGRPDGRRRLVLACVYLDARARGWSPRRGRRARGDGRGGADRCGDDQRARRLRARHRRGRPRRGRGRRDHRRAARAGGAPRVDLPLLVAAAASRLDRRGGRRPPAAARRLERRRRDLA